MRFVATSKRILVYYLVMDNLEYLCDHRDKQDRQSLATLLMKHSELLSLNCEIVAETGTDEEIIKTINKLYFSKVDDE